MKRFISFFVVILLSLPGCATLGALGRDSAVLKAKRRVAPALVHIRPVKEVFASGKREEILAVGSGFIVSSDGYVLTNEHVTGKSKLVTCVLNDKDEMQADVVGVDPETDIALLKLKTERENLPFAKLGDSQKLEAGQTVLAMGSPHGLARSVSLGIVSVPDRHLEEGGQSISPYSNYIQTDAAINFGNSGGPLVNLRGEVVGVNARVLLNAENVGFAIPVSAVREVMTSLKTHGKVNRSWIGITLQEMRAKTDNPSLKGVIIADVDPLGPAHGAGVKPGDILVEVDGTKTHARFAEDLPAVSKLIADFPVGRELTISVEREGEMRRFALITTEKGATRQDETEFSAWGFTGAEPTPEAIRFAQLPGKKGVVITGVQVGGIAGNAGLKQGDIILAFDGVEIIDREVFSSLYQQAVDSAKPRILLVVKHGALTRYVLVKNDLSSELETKTQEAEHGNGRH